MPLENVEGDICRCRGRSSEIRHFEVAQYASIVLNNPSRETTVLGGTSSPMTDHDLAQFVSTCLMLILTGVQHSTNTNCYENGPPCIPREIVLG
jgi:hypothetical protein